MAEEDKIFDLQDKILELETRAFDAELRIKKNEFDIKALQEDNMVLQELVSTYEQRFQALETKDIVSGGSGIVIGDNSGTDNINAVRKWRQIFDIYDLDNSNAELKVRGHGDNEVIPIAGAWKEVIAGTATLDTAIEITDDSYIYLKVNRTGATVSLEVESGATKGKPISGGDTYEVSLLWWVPWLSGAGEIDWSNIEDCRGLASWYAGA